MKLHPDDLVVASFQTSDEFLALPGTVDTLPPLYPTPMTRCFYCPPPTLNICPITAPVAE
jgi:hypothetical protein